METIASHFFGLYKKMRYLYRACLKMIIMVLWVHTWLELSLLSIITVGLIYRLSLCNLSIYPACHLSSMYLFDLAIVYLFHQSIQVLSILRILRGQWHLLILDGLSHLIDALWVQEESSKLASSSGLWKGVCILNTVGKTTVYKKPSDRALEDFLWKMMFLVLLSSSEELGA